MGTILVRYNEIGLKSDPVRRRFEGILKRNMIDMLANDSIEAIVTRSNARLYVETEDVDGAIRSLRKVFGIASTSVADVCNADLETIRKTVSAISKELLIPGETFAIDARRDGGSYGFTSMDLEKDLGTPVLAANPDKGIKVNLTRPDKTIFVEVRSSKAYIFTSYIRCHAGLPLGSQGKVLAYVDSDRGVLSAWLMMKRGCKVIVHGDHRVDLLEKYDPHLKRIRDDGNVPENVLGYVTGEGLEQLNDSKITNLPIFMPTIGMSDGTVGNLIDLMMRDRIQSVDVVYNRI